MVDEAPRTRMARAGAEAALVRVVHHYGDRPEFVVLGGLVPELLCSESPYNHAGTTDVDVQVDLEIAAGAVHTARLERALRNAEFEPDAERAWRWVADGLGANVVVRFELLPDLDEKPTGATFTFDECEDLGAARLRGTGYAARDAEVRQLTSKIGGVLHTQRLVTGPPEQHRRALLLLATLELVGLLDELDVLEREADRGRADAERGGTPAALRQHRCDVARSRR